MGKFRGLDSEPGWINRKFRDIERQLRELRAAKSLAASTIGEGGLTVKSGGGITITDGGTFQLRAADGTVIFEVISNANNPDPSGNPQPTIRIKRADGTAAFILEDPLPTVDGYRQILRMFDRAGNEILSEDATSGKGLANPWLSIPMFPSRYTDWPKSTSPTFEETMRNVVPLKNPTMTLGASYTSDAPDTTGECRFKVGGTVVGITQAFGFGIGTTLLADHAPLPAGLAIADLAWVSLEVRRTAGTGNVMAAPYLATGSQSL